MQLVLVWGDVPDVFVMSSEHPACLAIGNVCQWMSVYVCLSLILVWWQRQYVCLCFDGWRMSALSNFQFAAHSAYSPVWSHILLYFLLLPASFPFPSYFLLISLSSLSSFSSFPLSFLQCFLIRFPLRLGTLIGWRFCLSAVLHIRTIWVVCRDVGAVARRRCLWSLSPARCGCGSACISFLSKKSQKIFVFWKYQNW